MNSLRLTSLQRKALMAERDQASDAATYRRLLGLLALTDGTAPESVAKWLGVTRQSLYNWADRYVRTGRPSALRTGTHPGRPPLWDEDCTALLRASLHQTPEQFGYPAVNWTVGLLQYQLGQCLGRGVSDGTIRRRLHQLGYVWKRPRYVLKADPQREKKVGLAPVVLATASAQRGAV